MAFQNLFNNNPKRPINPDNLQDLFQQLALNKTSNMFDNQQPRLGDLFNPGSQQDLITQSIGNTPIEQQMMQQEQQSQQVNQYEQEIGNYIQQLQNRISELEQQQPQVNQNVQLRQNEEYAKPGQRKEKERKKTATEIKEESVNQRHIDKMNQKWNDEIDAKAESVRERRGVIDAMEALDDNKELDDAYTYSALKTFGLDYPVLLKPGSQEFIKLRTTFLKGLKSTFGGRIAIQEMNNFMAGIPDLMQTKEGRKRLYKDLRLIDQADTALRDARDEIVEENEGDQPKNLRSSANKRAEKRIDNIYNELKSSFYLQLSPGKRLKELPNYKDVPVGTRIQKGDIIHTATESGWKKSKAKE